MPIVIMKCSEFPTSICFPKPHAVWNGTMKEAKE